MSERLISAKGEFVRLRGPGAARRSLIVQRSELNDLSRRRNSDRKSVV